MPDYRLSFTPTIETPVESGMVRSRSALGGPVSRSSHCTPMVEPSVESRMVGSRSALKVESPVESRVVRSRSSDSEVGMPDKTATPERGDRTSSGLGLINGSTVTPSISARSRMKLHDGVLAWRATRFPEAARLRSARWINWWRNSPKNARQ
uniref:Uncharacterized protein n=1 Tax=Ditylenchus dipsaci TaxID=166011 RepID=A0A915ES50_9BILA